MVGMTRVSLILRSIYLQRTHPKHRLTAEEAETYVNVCGNVLLPFMTSSLISSHLFPHLLPHSPPSLTSLSSLLTLSPHSSISSSPPSSSSLISSHLLTLLPPLTSSPSSLISSHLLTLLLSSPLTSSPSSSHLLTLLLSSPHSPHSPHSHLLTLLPHLLTLLPPQCVLVHPKCWAVQATALLLRSQLERERRRTVERAMTQLQVLSLTLLSSGQLLNC